MLKVLRCEVPAHQLLQQRLLDLLLGIDLAMKLVASHKIFDTYDKNSDQKCGMENQQPNNFSTLEVLVPKLSISNEIYGIEKKCRKTQSQLSYVVYISCNLSLDLFRTHHLPSCT